MFVTRQDGEIRAVGSVRNDRYWCYVELTPHLPWFFAEVIHLDVGLLRHIFLADAFELKTLLTQQNSHIRVDDVLVVTPAYVNGTDGWKMERLQKLSLTAGEGAELELLSEVEGGHQYRIDAPETWGADLNEVIYLSPR